MGRQGEGKQIQFGPSPHSPVFALSHCIFGIHGKVPWVRDVI